LPLTIDSTRFGRIELAPDSAIEFPHGLVGFDARRFALIAREPGAAFLWLHAIDDPSLALPVTDPRRFFAGFAVELGEGEAARLGLPEDLGGVEVYVTVRAAERLEEFSANLRAPILVHEGRAHQAINQAPGAQLRAPLFGELVAGPAAA
jgi:flagellar assembly factor FliW